MKKPHNERKSKKKSKILLTTVGNEIVLSFFFLSLFVLFLNVLPPLMSLFFLYFPYFFYDLGGTKTNCQGWERKKERRKFGVGAISLIPLRPLWWQSRACTAWRWRRFESEGVSVFLTLVLSTYYLVMDVSDRGLGLEKWPVDVEGARG